jgi:tripartite-type tricarboxylate transporter receptor subunit TctC
LRKLLLAALLAVLPLACFAQAFPSRPIKLVVTFPPGGGTDVLARLLAAELAPIVGQAVIAENRPGATGNIGAEYVARSAPDGYTLLIVNSSFAINASVFPNLPFDTLKDFAPVVLFASVPSFVAVTPALGPRTLKELIALAKAQPGKLSYASCGAGSPQHLAAELFKTMTGTNISHIPYKGCAPALGDVMGGHVPISFNTAANTVPHINSGKLIAIATTGKKRFPLAPDVPTMDEGGLTGYDLEQWYGVLGPARMPQEIVDRLNGAILQVIGQKAVQDKMLAQGWAWTTSTPAAFAEVIRDDVVRYGKITRALGLKAD